MQIKETKCKTALSKSNLPGLDYSLNPYMGCEHRCAYCYVPNVMHIQRDTWGSFVKIKTSIPVVLSKELRNKKPGRVGISTVTDPYQPIEKKYRLTRYCLEQLLIHNFPVCVQTKSRLVIRDKDLLSKFKNAELMISIATLNDNDRKILEPASSSINERIEILKKFSDTPVIKSVFFGPVYPTVKPKEIPSFLEILKENNVSKIMIDKFNLKPGVWRNMQTVLKKQKKLQSVFSKNIKNNSYYNKIRKKLKDEGKKRNIKVKDAF